jgi:hypothetical protein
MEKNDQLNQIPDEPQKEIRDEKPETTESTTETETTEQDAPAGEPVETIKDEVVETREEPAPEMHEELPGQIKPEDLPGELIQEEIQEIQDNSIQENAVSDVQADLALQMTEQIHQAEAEAQHEEDEADEVHEPEVDFATLSKDELLEYLIAAVNVEDISKTKNRIALIKVEFLKKIREDKQTHLEKFLAGGGHQEDYKPVPDEAEARFQETFDIYRTKKAIFNEQQERLKLENLTAKQKILEDLKALVNSDGNLKKTYDEFRNLQDSWKELGQVPRNEINNLWQNYHFLVEKFFDKVKINKELKDLDLKKNLEQKLQLCEKAEELLLSPSIHRSFKLLQKYHEEWKEIGPVPMDKNDEIWERFKSVSDRINANRKDYYAELQTEQENNLMAKTALCERLESITTEELTNMQAWKVKTEEVEEMIKLWQAIGRTTLKSNDEIWQRFKKGVNSFYASKKEFFNSLKDQQVTNYNIKVNLCLQAEGMATSTNWKKTQMDLLRLQEEWKKTGPVPRKMSDKIWKRFRTACDAFFAAKSHYFANINQMEDENMAKKLDIIKQIEEYPVADNKNANLEALKNFQRVWMEIGHVPINQKDKLQNDFRTAINNLLDRLKISSVEASTLNYKSRVESMKASPDANKAIFRERAFLEGKISKLQSDINLWENNIGFLASSKNADILKEEFEKKIKAAKEELLLMKAKMKLLARS